MRAVAPGSGSSAATLLRRRQQRAQARRDLRDRAVALDRALDAAAARAAVVGRLGEQRDQLGAVAGREQRVVIAIGVEGEQAQGRERLVELALDDGVVEVGARLAPGRADVDEELLAVGAG